MNPSTSQQQPSAVQRIGIWYLFLLIIMGLFIVRSFYVQVIRYSYYHAQALSDQLKQYQIPATRGIIEAQDGNTVVPIVLNQKLYTVYADPTYVKNASQVANTLANILGGNASDYESKVQTKNTRYVVLAKKVTEDKKKQLLAYKYPGIGAQEQDYRTYPQGTLAAQLLGFVNDAGTGTYGIEQALNQELAGVPGDVKAITDAAGVPLAASGNNVESQPQAGDNVVLTVDVGIQHQLESILQKDVKAVHAQSGSALIMDPNTGAIKAMGTFPSFDPAQYYNVNNPQVFDSGSVSHPIEVGSIMKTLTTSAALNQGVIQPNTTFYDPAQWIVDGFKITDIEEDGGARTQSIATLLNLSLNTGATWELMQMGGGQLDKQGRDVWHDYMVNHFQLGKPTGVEQGYEDPGYVPSPENNGAGINLTYANTAFGQAMTATPLQMAAALSSVLNGGTYYKPTLVAQTINPTTGEITVSQPKVVEKNVVSAKVGKELIPLMQYVVDHHYIKPSFDQSKYTVGGKTGTAQIAKPGGGYYDNIYNGTYLGFVGGNKVQYVIAVFVNRPQLPGWEFAGTAAAQPVFADLAHMLINNSYVTPKN
jgi:cell division protein FtsI/penicillin-binding protein 2